MPATAAQAYLRYESSNKFLIRASLEAKTRAIKSLTNIRSMGVNLKMKTREWKIRRLRLLSSKSSTKRSAKRRVNQSLNLASSSFKQLQTLRSKALKIWTTKFHKR